MIKKDEINSRPLIYKLPSTMNTWLLNSIVIVVMGVCILRIALKMMNHK